jgi:hypothetical protein
MLVLIACDQEMELSSGEVAAASGVSFDQRARATNREHSTKLLMLSLDHQNILPVESSVVFLGAAERITFPSRPYHCLPYRPRCNAPSLLLLEE